MRERYPQGSGASTDGILRFAQNDRVENASAKTKSPAMDIDTARALISDIAEQQRRGIFQTGRMSESQKAADAWARDMRKRGMYDESTGTATLRGEREGYMPPESAQEEKRALTDEVLRRSDPQNDIRGWNPFDPIRSAQEAEAWKADAQRAGVYDESTGTATLRGEREGYDYGREGGVNLRLREEARRVEEQEAADQRLIEAAFAQGQDRDAVQALLNADERELAKIKQETATWRESSVWTPEMTHTKERERKLEQRIEERRAQLERYDTAQTNAQKAYEDKFTGQFGASYTLGRLTQDQAMAWNEYLENPTTETRAYAQSFDAMIEQFQNANAEALADDAAMPWLSQSLANYLPQLVDQTKAQAKGALTSAFLSLAAPQMMSKAIKGGIAAGSGAYSYQTMRGAAFKALLDEGIDEETARAAANDEAVVSSLIEMADTGLDIMTLGAGTLIDLVTKGGLKKLAGKAGEKAGVKLLKALGKYGLNIAGEWTEEGTQQAVSIANAERAEYGEGGAWGLAKDAAQVFFDAAAGKNPDAAGEIIAAGNEGAKIAAMMGGAAALTNQALTRALGGAQGQETPSQTVKTPGMQTQPGGEGTLPKLSMEDFQNSESSVWRNVAYEDTQTKNDITAQVHQQMVGDGEVIRFSGEDYAKVEDSYPDLRGMKKTERIPILKEKMTQLKTEIRNFLKGLKGISFEFEVNGNILEAKLYDAGIREVTEKLTKDKSAMLYKSEELFKNARYLYSTPDYDGNPDIYRWNYFYTPVELEDGSVVGVRIAVRDTVVGSQSQIYNWGIKKEAPLAGGQMGVDPLKPGLRSSGASSSTNIPQNAENINGNVRVDTPTDGAGASADEILRSAQNDSGRAKAMDFAARYGYGEHGRSVLNDMIESRSVSPDAVNQAFHLPYLWGMSNKARSEVELTSPIQEEAFNAGRLDRILSMKRSADTVTVWGKKSGLVENDLTKKLPRQTRESLHAMGNALGTKIVVEHIPAEQNANGYYKSSDGTIHIDADTTDPVMTVAKHEITHRMQELAPEAYTQFRDYAVQMENRGAEAGNLSAVEVKQGQYREISGGTVNLAVEEAMDEIAANYTEKILRDEKTLHDFVREMSKTEEKRSVGQKFFDAVHEFLRKIKEHFGKGKNARAKMDAEAEKAFGATVAELERAEELWKKAYSEAVQAAESKAGQAQKNTARTDGVKYSLNADFDKQFDQWMQHTEKERANSHFRFLVGTTSDALQSIGVSDYKIYWNAGKIAKIMSKHPAMTTDVIKSVPSVLERPVLVMQSQTATNRITLFGEALDADGKPVLVALELSPQNKSGEIRDFAVIASAYGKNNTQNLIDTSDILYVDPNKKRTNNWLLVLGLQLPSSITKYGSIGMVTYVHKDVNGVVSSGEDSGKTAMQAALEKAMAVELSDHDVKYSLREKDPPKKTGIAYKVFMAKNGQLYPPMVANPGGEGTPVGVWLDADVAPRAEDSKTGRPQVQAGGKGTNAAKGRLAFRPGWHLGDIPQATQFARKNPETGAKDLFPANFVWCECEYAMDHDYQDEAMSYGYTENGKFRHSYAGLPKLPTDGYYRYRTNPNPDTVPWVITGAMKVKRILTDAETDAICRKNGVEPMKRQGGPIDLAKLGLEAGDTEGKTKFSAFPTEQIKNTENKSPTSDPDIRFSLKKPVEETKTLVALHNLTAEKLKKVLKLGGFPMPSIAVTRTDIPHTNFGDITLVMDKRSIDPKADRKNTVYSADAWTPTFPTVEYEADAAAERRIAQRLNRLSSKVDEMFRQDLYRAGYDMSDLLNRYGGERGLIEHVMDNYGLKAAYLEEQGQHISPVMTHREADRGYLEARADKYRAVADVLGVSTGAEVGGLNLKALRERYRDALEQAFPGMTKSPFRMSGILRQVQAYLDDQGGEPVYETVTDGAATKKAVDDALNMEEYERWVRELFSGIEGDSGISNNRELYTPSGNRRSFRQTHYPVTLENIVKAMAGQNGGNTKNVAGFYGVKTLRAGMARRFKSIADMHNLENRLQNLTEEEFEAIHNQLQDRMLEMISRVIRTGAESDANSLGRMDSVGEILMEIADSGRYTVDSIEKAFAQYRYKVGNQLAMDIRDLLFDVSQMPVNLFEAKPQRAVGFDEVLAAVVPSGSSRELMDALAQAGVRTLEYRAGDEADRLEKVNSVEEARFSLKGQKDLERENAKLRETVAGLREQFRRTEFAKVDRKALDSFAKTLLKDYQSSADVEETRAALDSLYTYLANGENGEGPVWSEAYRRAFETAVEILEAASVTEDEVYRQYSRLRRYLREQKLHVPREMWSDLDSMGGYNALRRAYMGRLSLSSTDGAGIDQVYQELSHLYPEFFDEAEISNPADQLMRIVDVLDGLEPYEVNPYSASMRESASWLANDILERFYELPQARPTFADKAEGKLTRQVIRDAKKLEKLRGQKNARIAQLIAENRQKVKEATAKERQKRKREVDELKATVRTLQHMLKAAQDGSVDSRTMDAYREKVLNGYRGGSDTGVRLAIMSLEPKDRQAVLAEYEKLVKDYGAIPAGEKPAREVQVPKKTAPGKKVSQTVRTVLEAGATPEDAIPTIEQMVADGTFSYDAYTDEQAMADAGSAIERDGFETALSDWLGRMMRGEVSKKNTAMGWALYNNAANAGDIKTAMTVLNQMASMILMGRYMQRRTAYPEMFISTF